MAYLFYIFVVLLNFSFLQSKQTKEHKVHKNNSFMAVPFARSMSLSPIRGNTIFPEDRALWTFFAKLYEKNQFDAMIEYDEPLIPLKLHFIWIGSPVPTEFHENFDRWKELNPEFEFYLWTDAELKNFNLENQRAFDAALNYGEKADIWRYEIIWRYGGVYIDTDVRCLRSIKPLHYRYEFYAGLSNTTRVEVNNALFGAAPHHPVLRVSIDLIAKKGKPRHIFSETLERTGPFHFTKCFLEIVQKNNICNKIVAFPVSFFYPLPNTYHGVQPDHILQKWIRPESFTVHFWESRWMKPRGFVRRK